jgi:hypothetical protein
MKPASTQSDRNLNFDGIGEGPRKASNRFAGNKWSGHSNDGREVNFGRGPTRGNTGCGAPGQKGATASVTKDSYRDAPTSAVPAVPKQGSIRDNINRGSQVRNPGGTRDWMPSRTQNYRGNPDQIRVGQSGGPDYGGTTKGSKPAVAGGRSDFNYGPKSQY